MDIGKLEGKMGVCGQKTYWYKIIDIGNYETTIRWVCGQQKLIGDALDLIPDLPPLQDWDDEMLGKVVRAFMEVKFLQYYL